MQISLPLPQRQRTVSSACATPAVRPDCLALMGVPLRFARDQEIYGEHEPADDLYRVVGGMVRTTRILDDGRRQIGGFHLPGDVFGLEAGDTHLFSAEAVTAATVLAVKRSALVGLAEHDGDVARLLWALTATELQRVQQHVLLLIKRAPERVASFLLEMAGRGAAETIELPMSRRDIADYLGLTHETVSRTLTELENAAAIALPTARRIVLRNRRTLDRLNA
jgi:CRP-like cAMP-binding protein